MNILFIWRKFWLTVDSYDNLDAWTDACRLPCSLPAEKPILVHQKCLLQHTLAISKPSDDSTRPPSRTRTARRRSRDPSSPGCNRKLLKWVAWDADRGLKWKWLHLLFFPWRTRIKTDDQFLRFKIWVITYEDCLRNLWLILVKFKSKHVIYLATESAGQDSYSLSERPGAKKILKPTEVFSIESRQTPSEWT